MISDLEQLLAALEKVRPEGKGYMTCCPAHDDKNPSLSINEKDGKVLVHCHAGCTQDAVIAALKERYITLGGADTQSTAADGLVYTPFPADNKEALPDLKIVAGMTPSAVWEYRSADGKKILGYVCRIEKDDGGKEFRPLTPWCNAQGHIVWNVKGFPYPKPLYGLDLLAAHPEKPVLIVEGEKTADAARCLPALQRFVVVTWPGGAKSAGKADWSVLKGRDVVIWPDADVPGQKAAEQILEALRIQGARKFTAVMPPPSLSEGWDLADPIPAGVDVGKTADEALSGLKGLSRLLLSGTDLMSMDIPPRELIIDPFIAARSLNLLFAQRGIGKTWLSLLLASCSALGINFLGYTVKKAVNVMFIDGEMQLIVIQERLRALSDGKPMDRLRILPSESVVNQDKPLNIQNPEDRGRIMEMLRQEEDAGRPVDLIILDNLSSLAMGVDENDNTQLDDLLTWLIGLRHAGFAVLLVHHAGKSGDQRGASRREDFMDTVIKLERPQVDDGEIHLGAHFIMTFTKTRGEVPNPPKLDVKLTIGSDGRCIWTSTAPMKADSAMNALKCIKEEQPETQKELGEIMGVRASRASQLMKTLKQRGYVEKGMKQPTMTEKGEEVLKKLWPKQFRTAEEQKEINDAF